MKKEKLKIVVIENAKNVTGGLISLLQIINALKEKVTYIIAFQQGKKPLDISLPMGTKLCFYNYLEIQKSWKLLFYFPVLFWNSGRVLRILREEKIDVLHVNDLYNMIGVVVKILKPKTKIVYYVRLMPNSYARLLYNIWIKLILAHSDKVICVSQSVFNALPNSHKKQVIYDALAKPIEIESNLFPVFTFLYIGNYIPGKGQNLAIEAFASRQIELSNTRLLFVGDDMNKPKNIAYKRSLIEMAKNKGISHKVEFRGFESDLFPLYKQSQVVLNFSESESFSMVCLESLLNGTPVIATKCGGPEEIIEHNINGLLVKNKNIDAMADAMVTIYQQDELRIKMINDTKKISEKFSIEQSASSLLKVYQSI